MYHLLIRSIGSDRPDGIFLIGNVRYSPWSRTESVGWPPRTGGNGATGIDNRHSREQTRGHLLLAHLC